MPSELKPRLNLPLPPEREYFPRNLVRQVVCELRFPALLDLETSDQVPKEIHNELRREFPHFEVGGSLTVELPSAASTREPRYLYRSRDKLWTYALRPSALSLETTQYVRFSDFLKRLEGVVGATKKKIDLAFFTRVGLRYINALPRKQGETGDWVNPALAGALAEPRLGWMLDCFQHLRGYAQAGMYSLRHGIEPNTEGKGDYIIDSDFYKEDVEVGDAPSVLTALNRESYSLFVWAVGDQAREYMKQGGTSGTA